LGLRDGPPGRPVQQQDFGESPRPPRVLRRGTLWLHSVAYTAEPGFCSRDTVTRASRGAPKSVSGFRCWIILQPSPCARSTGSQRPVAIFSPQPIRRELWLLTAHFYRTRWNTCRQLLFFAEECPRELHEAASIYVSKPRARFGELDLLFPRSDLVWNHDVGFAAAGCFFPFLIGLRMFVLGKRDSGFRSWFLPADGPRATASLARILWGVGRDDGRHRLPLDQSSLVCPSSVWGRQSSVRTIEKLRLRHDPLLQAHWPASNRFSVRHTGF